MEILLIAKGFVTNSSSANYWLDDDIFEEGELEEFTKKINPAQTNINNKQENIKEINQDQQVIKQNQVLEETVIDFSIWLLFSLILIIVFFLRKLKKQ